jgi:hypothetical protein
MTNIVIALDIDDAILPINTTYAGKVDDNLQLLEINLKRLKLLIDKYNAKIFITSSWYSVLDLIDNKIFMRKGTESTHPIHKKTEKEALKLLKKYLDGFIIGKSKGDKIKDIVELLKTNTVISIDDLNLSHLKYANHLHINTQGLITNKDIFNINKFIKSIKFYDTEKELIYKFNNK